MTVRREPLHYAWVALAVTVLVSLMAMGIRSSAAVLIHPLEMEFGWSRAAISSALGLNLLLFGVAASIAGRFVDRLGARRVMTYSLALMSVGLVGSIFMTQYWQLILSWGVVIGVGSNVSASVLPAAVATRWFVAQRGMASGIISGAASSGQLVFVPILMTLVVSVGWRSGSWMLVVAAVLAMATAMLWMRDDPADLGLLPYGLTPQGSSGGATAAGPTASALDAAPTLSFSQILSRREFWFLAGSFFVCGATGSGLIGTHLLPHAIETGFPEARAAAVIGLMGALNFVGTMASGWLTDRLDARRILIFVYALRGGSLFLLPFVTDMPGLLVFGVIYGLDWFATGPPTVAMVADTFGRRSVGTVQGLIFLVHQIGAALFAAGGGVLRQWIGDYQLAFVLGGITGLIGAAFCFGLPSRRPPLLTAAPPQPAPQALPQALPVHHR